MFPRRAGMLVLALAVLLAGAGLVGWRLESRAHSSGAARGEPPRLMGRTDPRARVNFSLVLRIPGSQRLSRFLNGLYDPRSPDFHHFLDARAFGERFGLSEPRLRGVLSALAAGGVRIVRQYPQRTAIDASAPAGVLARMFGISLMDYVAADGRHFHAPVGHARVPAALVGSVSNVAGLDGRFVATPQDVPSGGLTPSNARLAYDLLPLYQQGIEGQGEKVAVISLATYRQSDLNGFTQQYGLPGLLPHDVTASSTVGGADDHSSEGQDEAALDLETIHGLAPQAEIFNYNAPSQLGNIAALVDRIVADGQVNIVSISYGACEFEWDSPDVSRVEHAFAAARAHGITIFVASGDSGSYTCQRQLPQDHRLAVAYPASSPNVIAVGGTSLSVSASGGYSREAAWESPLEQGGGGGGLSSLFARPPWQSAPGVANQFSNGRRQVPDVAGDADITTGWAVYAQGQLQQIGGTSAASPFWAASLALIDQYARSHGAGPLGFAGPMLYGIASSPQSVPPFHDITLGTNRYYPSTPGWDFATGLGSPDVYNLAQDVVAYLRAHKR